MPVRLKDIAKDLGVSTVTVSKVLRGNTDVGEKTRALVLERMRALNYQPNMLARGLASGRSYAVGLVVPDLVHPFFGEFAKSLGTVLRESGRALIVASSEENVEIERQEIRTLKSRGVDVLLIASCQQDLNGEDGAQPGKLPFLLIDRNFPEMEANFVGSDDVVGGELATRHLIQLGRRRIAHIGSHGTSPANDRLLGYRKALRAAEIDTPDDMVVMRESFEETGDKVGYEVMQALLGRKVLPDAVFCYNDLLAIGAMQAVMHAGLRIPHDIAFVGCGNMRYAEYLKVPLTSIDHFTDQMGRAAANLALELAAKPDQVAQRILIEPRLVVRQSSVVL